MAITSGGSTFRTYNYINPEPKQFVVKDSFNSSLFRVNGLSLNQFVPRFYLFSTNKMKNNETHYHLRTKSSKSLFMFVLYQAVDNFMRYVGFNPNETFEFLSPNPYRDNNKNESVLVNSLIKRLEIKERFQLYRGNYLRYVFINANFMSNVRELDMGFRLRFYAHTVDLIVNPYIELVNTSGNLIKPQDFVRNFLLTMNYPIVLYNHCRKHNYLYKLVRDYRKIQNKKGKFKPWSFIEALDREKHQS